MSMWIRVQCIIPILSMLCTARQQFGGQYTVFRTHTGSDFREVIAELPLRKATFPAPSWIHDFPCTPNYMVLPECPVSFAVKVGSSTAVHCSLSTRRTPANTHRNIKDRWHASLRATRVPGLPCCNFCHKLAWQAK